MPVKNLIYILLLLILPLLGGCADDLDEPAKDLGEGITLRVKVPVAARTRADADDLNEYRVRSLHLFFYPEAGFNEAVSEYIYNVRLDTEFSFDRDIRLELPADALLSGGLFGADATECYVYAVANVDDALLTAKTVEGLKATPVGSSFGSKDVQEAFAMDGMATIELDRPSRRAVGEITLRRAAAKITLAVDIPAELDITETISDPLTGTTTEKTRKYYSRANEMRVWMTNGVHTSQLNTPAVAAEDDCLYSHEILPSQGSGFTLDESQPVYKYTQQTPFYSYPNRWQTYEPKANSALTLSVPWAYYDDDGRLQNIITYYRIGIQPGKNIMERNMHYDMRVAISRLGGETVLKPVDMTLSWNYAMQWNTQQLPTDIKEIRYLLLNNNDFDDALQAYAYTMNNETYISIPFTTSHQVMIADATLTYTDYSQNTARECTISLVKNGTNASGTSSTDSYRPTTHFAGIEVDNATSTLRIRRDLLHLVYKSTTSATISSYDAISAYTFSVTLKHVDAEEGNPSSYAQVSVTQIPPIYITADFNSTGDSNRFVNNNNTTKTPNRTTLGYILKNANQNAPSSDDYFLGSVRDYASSTGSTSINNRNSYLISISKFGEGEDYIIGDPRTRTVNNLDGTSAATWSVSAKVITGGTNRRLTYYYPADDSADKVNFIAPQFRVASQYGITVNVTRKGAQRRCASYQEIGRPAGRWRLPTQAEIKYISNLSSKEFIPYLFGTAGNTANYWCASGAVQVNNSNNTVTGVANPTGTRAVRCVYDEWYWKDDYLTGTAANTFTWGDRARSTSGNNKARK